MAKGKDSARTMAKAITLFLTIVENSLFIVFSRMCWAEPCDVMVPCLTFDASNRQKRLGRIEGRTTCLSVFEESTAGNQVVKRYVALTEFFAAAAVCRSEHA